MHHKLAAFGEGFQLLAGLAQLFTLLGREGFEELPALHGALALLGVETVEFTQALAQCFLAGRWKILETGVVFEGFLLLLGRHALMVSDPVAGFAGRALLLLLRVFSGVWARLSSALCDGDGEQQGCCQNEPENFGFRHFLCPPAAFFRETFLCRPSGARSSYSASPSPSGLGYVISRLRRWINAAPHVSLPP